MDRARQPVAAIDPVDGLAGIAGIAGIAAESTPAVAPGVDPLAEEIRQSVFLLVGALGLMGMVALALLALTTGSGG